MVPPNVSAVDLSSKLTVPFGVTRMVSSDANLPCLASACDDFDGRAEVEVAVSSAGARGLGGGLG
jgi:hypothetical protein